MFLLVLNYKKKSYKYLVIKNKKKVISGFSDDLRGGFTMMLLFNPWFLAFPLESSMKEGDESL